MVLSGVVALLESDVKRVVALSTLSQLGFIFFCLGLGLKDVVFVHIVTHALVKALLFVCVGRMIEQSSHCQNIGLLRGYMTHMPVCFFFMVFRLFGLVGLPFIGAYFTKHAILIALKRANLPILIILIFYIGGFLTTAYSLRLIFALGAR